MTDTAEYRQYYPTSYSIPRDTNLNHYSCLIGVPYPYRSLIGQEVFVKIKKGNTYGPYLIVDSQASDHHFDSKLNMKNNKIAADINCLPLVHKKVDIVIKVRRALKE